MAASDRPRPTNGLQISPSGLAKIERKGFEFDDAVTVLDRDPLWRWQPAADYIDDDGSVRRRPDRWRLVGRGLAGLLLCVVIDLPRPDGISEVVTIFEASPRHESEYDEWVRRRP